MKPNKYIYIVAIVISLLLHWLGFEMIEYWRLFSWRLPKEPISQKAAPVVLELEKPRSRPPESLPPEEPPMPEEYIAFAENPKADRQESKQGFLASASSRSAAPEIVSPGNAVVPGKHLKGTVEQKDAPASAPQQHTTIKAASAFGKYKLTPTFSKKLLTRKSPERSKRVSRLSAKQKATSAGQIGEFRLNTVDWNHVSWMTAFKSRLYYVWYAPASYYMGLISGYTSLRFRVSKDGQLLELEILEHHGHPSLRESSKNAIESVFPFRGLPEEFPKEYLEISGRLIYPDIKEVLRRRKTR